MMPGRAILQAELRAANLYQGAAVTILVVVIIISPSLVFLVRNATLTLQVSTTAFFIFVAFHFRTDPLFFWGGGVSDPLCLSSSLALQFYNYSFLVNRDAQHLLAHAMASDFTVKRQVSQR
jgi:hypothetical protein